ncbi:hypothetical protein [Flavobacterium capsici]|uniref:Hydrolase n=1 Tax=Flavobacterium capsici TaxID=3075618 RepID=A0AA96J1P2_9FLAO|nr:MULTISPECIES: hypothetical protein [unclassified Flavobacterium]WNM18090.1 hypothetical protein RN608_08700 [Flavobacterium sp. PMR2A8]WNM22142.1 hypothetical protein RN605_02000 [Flavobacterium sp. PMTSA4]
MKKSLTLYLLIIALLMNVFTYKYFSSKYADELKVKTEENKQLKDSLSNSSSTAVLVDAFELKNNFRAQNYLYESKISDISSFEEKVKQALLAYNDSPEGNKYTDQEKIGEQKFIINSIKILNHRWIIADYSNGKLWGEVMLKYFINDDQTISFEVMNSYLYPMNLN